MMITRLETQRSTKNMNKDKSTLEIELCLRNVWKIVSRISGFSQFKLKRKAEDDKVFANGFDACLEWFRDELNTLEKEYERRK